MSGTVEPVFIALGSNLGDRVRNIREAIALLERADGFDVMDVAPLYESAPMYVEDQPSFVNTGLMGRAEISVDRLLALLKSVEKEVGRRTTYRNGPRVIDLDIVYFGDRTVATADLTVPHPRRRERLFVLQPLADLAPEFRDPETGDTLAALRDLRDDPPLRHVEEGLPSR